MKSVARFFACAALAAGLAGSFTIAAQAAREGLCSHVYLPGMSARRRGHYG